MPLAVVRSRALIGLESPEIQVEVQTGGGLPAFSIVGLPEASVREARDRVRAAIIHSGFTFPSGRITVNLAPADIAKAGSRYDLAIAVGVLAASEGFDQQVLDRYEFCAELSLTGALRPVKGLLPTAFAAQAQQHRLVVATDQAPQLQQLANADIAVANHLLDVTAEICGSERLSSPSSTTINDLDQKAPKLDIAEVRGQQQAKRALTIAATGEHHLLMVGPPGAGKSMLAQRFSGLLPPLTDAEWAEVATIQSVAGHLDTQTNRQRPFRYPHHSSSTAALVGGGSEFQLSVRMVN